LTAEVNLWQMEERDTPDRRLLTRWFWW